jgi:hypothetical protein
MKELSLKSLCVVQLYSGKFYQRNEGDGGGACFVYGRYAMGEKISNTKEKREIML